MKAWQVHQFCEPHEMSLNEVPTPAPGEGEVLVRNRAAGVNFFDLLFIQGKYQTKPPFPFTPGGGDGGDRRGTGVGRVRAERRRPGDRPHEPGRLCRVFGRAGAKCRPDCGRHGLSGGLRLPRGVPDVVLRLTRPRPAACGRVVVGSCGRKRRGHGRHPTRQGWREPASSRLPAVRTSSSSAASRVRNTCSTTATRVGWTKPRNSLLGPGLTLSTTRWVEMSLTCRPSASHPAAGFWFVGFASGRIPTVAANRILLKNISIVGVYWGRQTGESQNYLQETQRELDTLYQSGAIRPVVSRTYPLADAPKALRDIAARQVVGKAALTMD